jgi:HEAT repeat protein/beta-lactamase regulating signal transducer with metallopeptidase domain
MITSVLGILLKGTALLLAAAVLAVALRRASAALRHLVWSAAVITILALPILALVVPWRLAVVPVATAGLVGPVRPAAPVVSDLSNGAVGLDAPNATVAPNAPDVAAAPAPPVSPVSPTSPIWPTALVALWTTGALLLLARLALGAAVLARAVRTATPLTTPDWTHPLLEAADRLALDRAPRLLMSARLPLPYACGLLRPTIVLPESAAEWSDRRRRAVLCHELAHVRRFDLLLNALGQVACAVWWFHPLVWIAARRLRLESERACDDLVLGVGTRASEYANHLLNIVCNAARAHTPAVALPMAQGRELEGRLLAILERGASRIPTSRRHATLLAVLALSVVVPLAALAPSRGALPEPEWPNDDQAVADSTAATVTEQEPQQPAAAERATPALAAPSEPRPAAQRKDWWRPQVTASQDTSSQRVVLALVRALSDPVVDVRSEAAYALGQIEAEGAVVALAARLTTDSATAVREMAAWALGQIESHAATTALSAALVRDSAEGVRAMAAWALGQLEDPAAVSALAAAVATDRSVEVRGRAAWALGTIEAQPAPPALLAALGDASTEVRLRAAWALGQIEDPAAVPALTKALSETTGETRHAVLWALGRIGGPSVEAALLHALEDPDPEVRAMAARALAGSDGDPWPRPWPMPIIR